MLGLYSLGRAPLGALMQTYSVPAPVEDSFDASATLLAQYANSPVIIAMVQRYADQLNVGALFDQFYNDVWNLDTCGTYGLDRWGRVLNVKRTLTIPDSETYIGFEGQTTGQNWNHGIWYRGADATTNVSLDNETYRRVLNAKARFNICDGSIASINQILIDLFPGYGNCYVVDGLDMTMEYHFGGTLSLVDYAIASQDNILPRPAGVAATITQG